MTSLFEPPLLSRLRAAERILIAGAGGGFDVYAGLPLALETDSLFVNPLMTLYFGVTVEALASEHLYLDRIEHTRQTRQISSVIEDFRESLPRQRPPRQFPH